MGDLISPADAARIAREFADDLALWADIVYVSQVRRGKRGHVQFIIRLRGGKIFRLDVSEE